MDYIKSFYIAMIVNLQSGDDTYKKGNCQSKKENNMIELSYAYTANNNLFSLCYYC